MKRYMRLISAPGINCWVCEACLTKIEKQDINWEALDHQNKCKCGICHKVKDYTPIHERRGG